MVTPNCNDAAKKTVFAIVPNPGVTFSGNQIKSTKQLTIKKAQPSEIPACLEIPCAKTVHGGLPKLD